MTKCPVLLLSVFLLLHHLWAGDPSRTFQHDNQRTGRTSNTGVSAAGLLWVLPATGSLEASPVFDQDGTMFVASASGDLYSLAPDGRQRWIFRANASLYSTPAIGTDGTLYFGDLSGWLYALNPAGGMLWTYPVAEGADRRIIASPVVAADGRSYWVSWNSRLYVLDPHGRLLWTAALGGLPSSPPALDHGGNLYLASLDSENPSRVSVHKFSPNSVRLWEFEDDLGIDLNRIIGSVAIDEERGRLYVGASRESDGILYGLSLIDGHEVLRIILPRGIVSSPALGEDGAIYVGCMDGRLYSFEPTAGGKRWEWVAEGYFVMGSPTVDGAGRIYIGDSDGILYAISPLGQELWRFKTSANIVSSPVIADDGTLYVSSTDGVLYALGNTAGFGRSQFRQHLRMLKESGR